MHVMPTSNTRIGYNKAPGMARLRPATLGLSAMGQSTTARNCGWSSDHRIGTIELCSRIGQKGYRGK
jgi:hypothetical protein